MHRVVRNINTSHPNIRWSFSISGLMPSREEGDVAKIEGGSVPSIALKYVIKQWINQCGNRL